MTVRGGRALGDMAMEGVRGAPAVLQMAEGGGKEASLGNWVASWPEGCLPAWEAPGKTSFSLNCLQHSLSRRFQDGGGGQQGHSGGLPWRLWLRDRVPWDIPRLHRAAEWEEGSAQQGFCLLLGGRFLACQLRGKHRVISDSSPGF